MCGINGLFNFDRGHGVDPHILAAMSSVAAHRGPDDYGYHLDGPMGLAFNRLSIIDLAGGHQPMSNEDGSVWIIFNGEIYNFVELRNELLQRGHQFRTRSDTETIVHAWEEHGEDCVDKLRGMFAFAIWDSRQQILFIARDRLGIKPLFYYADKTRFAFASELKSLTQLPEIPCEVETRALGEFLRRRYVVAPHTMLRGVRKLEPGHTLRVTANGFKIKRYWDVPVTETRIAEGEAVERLGSILEEAVRMHLVSDVPLGAFLSGGLDSSCVVALMSKLGVSDIKTFSIGYDSGESELEYARIVADHFKTDHHELRLSAIEFRETLPKVVWHMDEPVGDQAAVPLYYLSEFARQRVKVALSGEGSDELFGGYWVYNHMLAGSRARRIRVARMAGKALGWFAGSRGLKKRLDGFVGMNYMRKWADVMGSPLDWSYGGCGSILTAEQVEKILLLEDDPFNGAESASTRSRKASPLNRMCYVDLTTWLPDDLLVKADRMSMAHSLELRVPFLDHRLVEFAASLPPNMKIRDGVTKYLLKKWSEPLLPANIVHREKKGFPVPIAPWFRGDLAGFVRETLLSSSSSTRQFFERSEIESLLQLHEKEDQSDQIYSFLVFNSWYEQFVEMRSQRRDTPSLVH